MKSCIAGDPENLLFVAQHITYKHRLFRWQFVDKLPSACRRSNPHPNCLGGGFVVRPLIGDEFSFHGKHLSFLIYLFRSVELSVCAERSSNTPPVNRLQPYVFITSFRSCIQDTCLTSYYTDLYNSRSPPRLTPLSCFQHHFLTV